MIPPFPNMRELRLADQAEIEAVTKRFPPYSDFNFVNLWSWDVASVARVCVHKGNLVLRFADYITGEAFYMLIGHSRLTETVRDLIALSERFGMGSRLKLIPQCVAAKLDPEIVSVRPSTDHRDYVVDVASLAVCAGRKWHRHRNFVHRFEREHPSARYTRLDLDDADIRAQILRLFGDWCEGKAPDDPDSTEHEREALRRCLESFPSQLMAGGVYVADRLAAFAITESVGGGYAVDHFEKADRWSFVGVVQFLQWQMALALHDHGIRYLNIEQDLGLAGLRRAKRARHPVAYLQKYEVTLVVNDASGNSRPLVAGATAA